MRRVLIAAAALTALALPAAARATTETAVAGTVTARLQYTGAFPAQRDLRLSITDQGRTLYDRPISSRYCGRGCQVATGPGGRALRFTRLALGAPSSLIVDVNTGGAHCCTVAQVFVPRAGGHGYSRYEHDFYDAGYRLETLSADGARQFVTADEAFAYEFTDFADSGMPIEVLQLIQGRFLDISREFPAAVNADAGKWLAAYHARARAHYRDTDGVIAAWAADEYTLGEGAHARSYLNAQARAGHLHSALAPDESGRAFVARLLRFLRARGYTR